MNYKSLKEKLNSTRHVEKTNAHGTNKGSARNTGKTALKINDWLMQAKVAVLNLCLGLKNKTDLVKQLILDNNVDICCQQETEIEISYPTKILSFSGYNYKSEKTQ